MMRQKVYLLPFLASWYHYYILTAQRLDSNFFNSIFSIAVVLLCISEDQKATALQYKG